MLLFSTIPDKDASRIVLDINHNSDKVQFHKQTEKLCQLKELLLTTISQLAMAITYHLIYAPTSINLLT